MPEEYVPDISEFATIKKSNREAAPTPASEQKSTTLSFDIGKNEIIIRMPANTLSESTEKKHPFQELLYSLRGEGVRVSTSEWLDLQKVLASDRIHNLEDLYVVARALLVKHITGYPRFDRVFGKMFYGLVLPDPSEEPSHQEQTDEEQDEQTDEKQDEQTDEEQDEQTDEKQDEQTDEKKQSEEENLSQEIVKPGFSEERHGGTDVHKAIEDSKSSGDEGGGEKKTSEEHEKRNDKEKKKTAKGKEGGSGGFIRELKGTKSTRDRIEERIYDQFDTSRVLSSDQFDLALAKLSSIIEEKTETPTPRVNIEATVNSIAYHAGIPELVYQEEDIRKPHVMLFFDVGGSTDNFRPIMEKLFAAAKDRLDDLEIFYFHNAIYGEVWPQKDGNWGKNFIPLREILRKEGDSKIIMVGDAWMKDTELYGKIDNEGQKIDNPGGIDSFEELKKKFDHIVWINPILENLHDAWDNSGSIAKIKSIFPMYDLSLEGIEKAVEKLMEE